MKYPFSWIFTIIVTLSMLFACSAPGQTNSIEEGYPSTNEEIPSNYEIDQAYPGDDLSATENQYYLSEISIPSPEPGHGVVHGVLKHFSQRELPYLAPALYLGEILQSDEDSAMSFSLLSVSIEDDPIADQAVTGEFVFNQIPPGDYGLFLWTPGSAFIIEDALTQQSVFISVEAGQVYDIGTIYIE